MSTTTVGIIGGTGLYSLEGLSDVERHHVSTPFGAPSSALTIGYLDGVKLAFIARHGEGHVLLPSEINSRANIYALKLHGAQWCISVSAVGSLQEQFAPGDIVIPDQLIDRTAGIRPSTFFGRGVTAHVAFASPFCPVLSQVLFEESRALAQRAAKNVHRGGTYVCMEGPQFSTRAESQLYRSWGASLIGMTALPEAKLAREAEISYGTLALVTDYDCWRSEQSDVDIVEILDTMQRNVEFARLVLRQVMPRLAAMQPSALAADALRYALITKPELIPDTVRRELAPLLDRYLGGTDNLS